MNAKAKYFINGQPATKEETLFLFDYCRQKKIFASCRYQKNVYYFSTKY